MRQTKQGSAVERMKKTQVNYAFIDGNNLHLTMVYLGWALDYKRFRVYLSEHYGVAKAYYFIGYVPENTDLYVSLQSYGYVLVHKPTLRLKDGKIKGNCDAVLVTSDGDFYCLVHYLQRMGKLQCVLAPCREGCSHLLKKAAQSRIAFVDDLREKLEYKRKEPRKDETSRRSFHRDSG